MPVSELKLIKRCTEFCPQDDYELIPYGTRGIYTLLNRKRGKLKKANYDVIYVGLSAGTGEGIRRRLRSHAKSRRKRKLWTHFSIFEVWDNITEAEIAELEGLFRHIYRKDTQANRINKQRAFKKLYRVRKDKLHTWKHNAGRT